MSAVYACIEFAQVPRTLDEARAQIGRVVLHAFLANSAQWFDLMALVVLGSQLTAAMAPPQLSQHQQLGLLFAVFAAGHALWLVGAYIWPWLLGRLGRRAVLAWTVGLSAFPTALLGCMPAYSEVSLGVVDPQLRPAAVLLTSHRQEQLGANHAAVLAEQVGTVAIW